ncbi:MAG: tetratricopeptide repeat protein [Verrucomicrobiota bacterium]
MSREVCHQRRRAPLAFAWLCLALIALRPAAFAETLAEAQVDFLHGRYDEVVTAAQKELTNVGGRDDWRRLLIKTLLIQGRYNEAYDHATSALAGSPASVELRLLIREAALYRNDLAEANRRLTEISTVIESRPPSNQNGPELVALGRALLLLGVEPRLVLENCFQRAQKLTPPPREAFLASGQLALDKRDFKLAADAFRAGLKIFPDDSDLTSGVAQSFATGNREEMLKAIEATLSINPRHIPTLLLLADHLIDAEQYDEAEKQLATVLAVNPSRPEAHAFRSVLAHLRNDSGAEQKHRAEALKFWKTNPLVDHLIGRKLSEKYRFAEGAAAQRRALKFEPDYLPARRQLAEDLLRLGLTTEGWELAQAVHQADAYDVTAFNLTTLHDQMTKFQTLSNAHFIVRMSTHEARIYGDRVLALLIKARETLLRKYGVTLEEPTTVEIFPEQKDFAVRTFGMPGNPGYLGVCFGSVITANSPASQAPNPANWEDVLWHEFCHVVTLTATRNRMPRWLSEGISVYEERQADPTWGDRMNLSFREMILNGQLTPLGQLSSAFLTPKNGEALQFAYYESSLAVEFIVEKFGFEALKKILGDLRDGMDINQAISRNTLALPELEKQFAAFARAQAEALAPGVDLSQPPEKAADAEKLLWTKQHPDNFHVQFEAAEKLLSDRKWAEARPLLESLAEKYHGESRAENPLWLLAVAQRHLRDTNAELATLQKFARQESDFLDLFSRLIELSVQRRDWNAVTNYASRFLAINPLLRPPYEALAKAERSLGNRPAAIRAYRNLLQLAPPDPAQAHFQLAQLLHAEGEETEARRQVLQSLEAAPRFRDAQRLLLELADKNPQPSAGKPASKEQP